MTGFVEYREQFYIIILLKDVHSICILWLQLASKAHTFLGLFPVEHFTFSDKMSVCLFACLFLPYILYLNYYMIPHGIRKVACKNM